MAGSLGVVVAFSAGLFSFLSPCVLPLFPSYLSFITGMSLADLSTHLTAAGRHRRDRAARDRPAHRVLGGARRAVPALGVRARRLPSLLQALPPVHSRGRARRRRAAGGRGRARAAELVRDPQLLGDLAHPGVAPEAPLSAPLRVHVRVPATSANLGPGFDTLGLALALHNEVQATEAD